VSGFRSKRSISSWGPTRIRQDGTVCLRLRRLENRRMLSGATPDPGSSALDLSSLPHLADSPVHLVSAVFGIDSIRSLADQISQSALALRESIQQTVEAGVQGGWADGSPASVRTLAHDLASAIRSQVGMSVSQSGSLADQIRSRIFAELGRE